MRTGSGAKIWPVSRDKKTLAEVPLMERCNPKSKSIKGILARYRRTRGGNQSNRKAWSRNTVSFCKCNAIGWMFWTMRYGRGKHKISAESSASTSRGVLHHMLRSSSLCSTWIGTRYLTRIIFRIWSRCNIGACVTSCRVHHLQSLQSTNYRCAPTVQLFTTNFVPFFKRFHCGSFV